MKFPARSNYVKHLDTHIEKSLRKVRPIPPSRIRSSNFTYFKNRFLLFIASVISFRYSSDTVCYVWKSSIERNLSVPCIFSFKHSFDIVFVDERFHEITFD